jgi:L-fucose isomerase-like protein
MKIAILPLGRPTFDVPYAEEKLALMLAALKNTNHTIVGSETLLMDADQAKVAIQELKTANVDHVLVLQVTFTDASMMVQIAKAFDVAMSIWAVPEPRAGGRLRLNSFCGLNLASHALSLNKRAFSWLYLDPAATTTLQTTLDDLFAGRRLCAQVSVQSSAPYASPQGDDLARKVAGKRVARIGERPDGFDTCDYNAGALMALSGVAVDELTLDDLFTTAARAKDAKLAEVRHMASAAVTGLDDVDPVELARSLRLKVALDEIRTKGRYDAFAIRCWPETFTQYGGAVCGPAAMMGEARVPCACEADVYGALTQLILQEAAQAPVFLTDLVDMDADDNTGVVWHCGQAPISMREPDIPATATIHTNRKMPLLYEFPLRAGRVTFMRISQAFGEPKMVLAGGEMLKRPMSFTGTSGVVRFDRDADKVLGDVMASGLEHHMALAYGEHRPLLRATAAAMKLPILEL